MIPSQNTLSPVALTNPPVFTLKHFLQRVDWMRTQARFLYQVRKAVVFGNAASDPEGSTVLDICVDRARKPIGDQMFMRLTLQRGTEATSKGRFFK